MSRLKARPRADHRHAAGQAREMPGQWVLAGTYRSSQSADTTARSVRTGERNPAYLPSGAFKARVELTDDSADLWVCYVGNRTAADFQASIEAGLTEDYDAFSRRLEAASANASERP